MVNTNASPRIAMNIWGIIPNVHAIAAIKLAFVPRDIPVAMV